MIAEDLSLTSVAPDSVVVGEPFDVDLVAYVERSNGNVDVKFELPDGVSLVGGDCGAGSGLVVCGIYTFLGAVQPLEVSVQMVVDADGSLAAGGSFEFEAVTRGVRSVVDLNEETDFTPENNIATFNIEAAAS